MQTAATPHLRELQSYDSRLSPTGSEIRLRSAQVRGRGGGARSMFSMCKQFGQKLLLSVSFRSTPSSSPVAIARDGVSVRVCSRHALVPPGACRPYGRPNCPAAFLLLRHRDEFLHGGRRGACSGCALWDPHIPLPFVSIARCSSCQICQNSPPLPPPSPPSPALPSPPLPPRPSFSLPSLAGALFSTTDFDTVLSGSSGCACFRHASGEGGGGGN